MPGLVGHELWGPLSVSPALSLLTLLVNKEILVLIIVIPRNFKIRFIQGI